VNELQIRTYKPEDQDTVLRLHYDGLNQMGANIGTGPWDDDLLNIENEYINNNGDFLICTWGSQIIGMGALRRKDKETAEIKRMRVVEAFQGRGIGKIILMALKESGNQKGYKRLVLDTTSKQIPAQKLYITNGFKEIRREVFKGGETIYFEKWIESGQLCE
jgi:ribosomal protein S18 acetylase RimI-like enzyme